MLEPPRPSAEAPYTPCYLCDGVVRVGSMRFAVREPPRAMQKYPTHSRKHTTTELALCVGCLWSGSCRFEEVRGA